MKVTLGLLVLFALICHISGQVTSTQTVTAYCTRLALTNQLQFDFRLAIKQDPKGVVYAADSSQQRLTSGCTIDYDTATNSHYFRSLVSLTNTGSSNNGCGYTLTTSNNIQLYTWRLHYYELPDFLNDDLGLNRRYTAVCDMSETTSDTRLANLLVNAPNLDQTVTVSRPAINLYVLYESNGNYIKATTTTTISTDAYLKLRLEVEFGTFNENEIYAVAGRLTQASGTSNFVNPTELFNNIGCPSNSQFGPRENTSVGFHTVSGSNSVSPWASETNRFRAWQFGGSNTLHFRVYYTFCRNAVFNGDPSCVNPCFHFSNNQGRRRRDTEQDENTERTAVVSIRFTDQSDNQQRAQTSEDNTMVYVGSGVAVGVAIIVLFIVIFSVAKRSRVQREDARRSSKVPPEGFTNAIHY